MFRIRRNQRIIAATVLTTFTSLVFSPVVSAIGNQPLFSFKRAAPPAVSVGGLGARLMQMHEHLKAIAPESARSGDSAKAKLQVVMPDSEFEYHVAGVLDAAGKARNLLADSEKRLAADEQRLQSFNVPEVILQRQRAAVAEFQSRRADFENRIDAFQSASKADKAGRLRTAGNLAAFLAKYPNEKLHQFLDMDKLPFQAASAKARAPHLNKSDFPANNVADRAAAAPSTIAAKVGAPGADLPVPADSTGSEDVQLTQAVRDQAAQLGNDPVKIFNWVRNNIQYLPTFGSVQGSDLTLTMRRGNAFDTASLLIALYRAAGISSRYVYGTIDVPTAKAMNWLGGLPDAAKVQAMLAQGGIPNVAIPGGGGVQSIQMEHVWVEAFVDFSPSRGAVNRTPSTWVPLDASFKQYQFTQGLNLQTAEPFDANDAITKLTEGATISADGTVQNLNQAKFQTALQTYLSQVQAHLNSVKPNATVDDIFGKQSVIQTNTSILLGSLPYTVVVKGSTFSAIPDAMRHKVAFKLYGSPTDSALGNVALDFQMSLPALNGRRLGITYVPATDADAQLLQSYLAQGATSLPGYLINLKPQVQLDGVTVSTGPAFAMGQVQQLLASLSGPNSSDNYSHTHNITSGDELVLSVNGNGITQDLLNKRAAAFQSDNAAENLHHIALTYWMEYDLLNRMAAQSSKAGTQRLVSMGLFASPVSANYSLGIPIKSSYKGRTIDVSRSVVAITGSQTISAPDFQRFAGRIGSFLEGKVFEQLLGQRAGWAQSSVQAMIDANNQQIPIHTITKANLTTQLAQIVVTSDVQQDIVNATNAGKVVFIPQQSPSHAGFQGTGYIVEDPETGAGAYLLQKGLNGGEASACSESAQGISNVIAYVLAAVAILVIISILITVFPATVGVIVANVGSAVAGASAIFKSAVAAFVLAGMTFTANASSGECSCAEHVGRCLDTNFGGMNVGGPGSANLCSACYDRCRNTGEWPDEIEIFGGGPLNLKASCNYPGR